jgi:hypothetical protein
MPGIADKFTQSAQSRLLWPGMTTGSVARARIQRFATDSIFKQPKHFEHASAISRRDTPELCMNLPPNRGRGECRVPLHPQPRVQNGK